MYGLIALDFQKLWCVDQKFWPKKWPIKCISDLFYQQFKNASPDSLMDSKIHCVFDYMEEHETHANDITGGGKVSCTYASGLPFKITNRMFMIPSSS